MAARTYRIAGAGPAGLAAAITLARGGAAVELYERGRAPGARFQGGLQLLESYSDDTDVLEELNQLGLATEFWRRPATRAELRDAGGRATAVSSRRPFGYFILRGPGAGSLEHALAAQALALGVRLHCNTTLELERADIAATGPGPADGVAKEEVFETDDPDRIEVLFDPALAPGGYAYLFLIEGIGTLGIAVLRQFERLEPSFERCRERFHAAAPFTSRGPRSKLSYMNFFLRDAAARPAGPLHPGEAGGYQDYLFGLGIRYALRTGQLAARCLLEGRPFEALCQQRFGPQLEGGIGNRWLYELGGGKLLGRMVRRAGGRDFRELLRRLSRPGVRSRACAALARQLWRRPAVCGHKLPHVWCRPRSKTALGAQP